MHINISTGEANKGSSRKLVNYLEKENRQPMAMHRPEERWFTSSQQEAEAFEVRQALDGNIAKLGKSDAKFFLVNISPSQKEIRHLLDQYGGQERERQLKNFAEKVMDEYARNFKRPGIQSSKDLLWFGKLEHYRYFSYRDKEVKTGERKRGEKKPGDQLHIQVIVSRKDISNTIKLSPMNTSRGANAKHSKKLGQFDRVSFKQCGETLFDQTFSFDRNIKETIAYARILKHGKISEREKLDSIQTGAQLNPHAGRLALRLINTLYQQQNRHSQIDQASNLQAHLRTTHSANGLLEALLEEKPAITDQNNISTFKRRKKKKGQYHQDGLSR